MALALTLGPIPYHWSAEEKRDFYARIADEAPVEVVYVGEVICSKRSPFFDRELPEVIERLERAGKKVVLASLAEVILKRERAMTAALIESPDHEIEINNNAGLFHARGRQHRIGPLINVYNEHTLRFLAARGATHFTLPAELPREAVAVLAAAARDIGVGIEVQVFGRASLALSARCYHARAYGRSKDNCQFVCEEHPDGMPLKTLAGADFLVINGIQTLSAGYVSLVDRIDELRAIGVGHCRLMPQRIDMVGVAAVFAQRIGGAIGPDEAAARLLALDLPAPLANGFWHGVAGERRVAAVP
ncbi:MAG: U32 family peptidase [Alphaproteobacteria bacterium]|nr:MAG: U32 family peptidase [Alphaproteobacteria bacterium]